MTPAVRELPAPQGGRGFGIAGWLRRLLLARYGLQAIAMETSHSRKEQIHACHHSQWPAAYLEERRPHWGERHYADHIALARAGGELASRGTRGRGETVPGPLHVFMPLALRDLNAAAIKAWAAKEGNPTVSAYVQTLLLTGARLGEVMVMRWEDLNVQWRGLTIRDKVEGVRVIPLTPYVHHLRAGLPRRGAYVFASNRKEGAPITEPNHAHHRACQVAGIEELTLHGLRAASRA